MRFRLASVAAVVVVPVVLAGCSAQDPAGAPASKSSAPAASKQAPNGGKVEGVAWVNRLCGLVGGFAEAQRTGPKVDKSSPQAFKTTAVAHLESAVNEANRTLHGLRTMKSSPIEGGDGITNSFEHGFVRARDVLQSAKTQAEQVDTSDKRAFMQGVQAVRSELQKGQKINFSEGFKKFKRNKQLNAAAAQAPKCKSLMKKKPQPKPPQQPQPQPQQPQQRPR